jgi:cell division protein FtsQ
LRKKIHIIPIIILVILLAGFLYVSTYNLKNIEINGCVLSSEEEIRTVIKRDATMNNTILLYLKNKMGKLEEIPFVAKVDIDFVDKNSIKVDVYEKSVAGCIEYMESYIYFDKDGIVLETSKDRFDGVPYIKGLTVQSWQIGEKLPVDNKKKFDMILNITQLVEKYDLDIQGIEFKADGEVVLRHDNIEIEVGDGSNLAIQMMNLGNILKEVEGKSGVLYMKEYSNDNPTASFKEK